MDEKKPTIDEVKTELDQCSVKLSEYRGKTMNEKLQGEFQKAEEGLKACRLMVDEIEGKSGNETLDSQHAVVTKLRDVRKSLRHLGMKFT
ncbi:MAG: hypothetical protein GF405_05070 [Candidatus Eisenbacteria bacterium]|nr:hypothetical protein [Candidatus Eisenbacteria bacterium]